MWCSLTQTNTDSDVMVMFLQHLARQLDREEPGWQESTTILLDNATWHSSADMQEHLARLKLDILYSGPYAYSTAAIELVFTALKRGDLNPARRSTGKKALSEVADMVVAQLTSIPKSVVVRYWHLSLIHI